MTKQVAVPLETLLVETQGELHKERQRAFDAEKRLHSLELTVREHVAAWRTYFAATGGKPEQLWPTMRSLVLKVEK